MPRTNKSAIAFASAANNADNGITLDDLKAGNAIFTVVSNTTGASYTYKITKSKDTNQRGVHSYYVKLLTGENNESDYTYIGLLVFEDAWQRYTVKATKSSPNGAAKTQYFLLIDWLFKKLSRNLPYDYAQGARVLLAGRCLRCGRTLTVESSINAKFGPECVNKVWG